MYLLQITSSLQQPLQLEPTLLDTASVSSSTSSSDPFVLIEQDDFLQPPRYPNIQHSSISLAVTRTDYLTTWDDSIRQYAPGANDVPNLSNELTASLQIPMTCKTMSGNIRSEGVPGSRSSTLSYSPSLGGRRPGARKNTKASPLSLLVQSLSLSSPTPSSSSGHSRSRSMPLSGLLKKNGTKKSPNSNKTEVDMSNRDLSANAGKVFSGSSANVSFEMNNKVKQSSSFTRAVCNKVASPFFSRRRNSIHSSESVGPQPLTLQRKYTIRDVIPPNSSRTPTASRNYTREPKQMNEHLSHQNDLESSFEIRNERPVMHVQLSTFSPLIPDGWEEGGNGEGGWETPTQEMMNKRRASDLDFLQSAQRQYLNSLIYENHSKMN